jgi:hypothetical protein
MSDNELDNLFKEAAEGFTPPQDESAWKQMAAMLDQQPVKTTGFRNWKTISVLTITGVISVLGVWFATTGGQEEISQAIEKNGADTAAQVVVQEQEEQLHPAGDENLTPPQALENKHSGIHALSKAVPDRKNRKNHDPVRTSSPAGNLAIVSGNNEQPGVSERQVVTVSQAVSEAAAPRAERNTTPAVEEVLPVPGDSINQTIREAKTDSAVVSEIAAGKEERTKSGRAFSIKAAVSPDFSSVNFFSAGKSGFNFGFLAGYSFNNRWSVYTGVISSKKLYATKDVEGSYTWGGYDYPVKELDGDCRILDIPVNVYYTFFPERSFSLRAGLGFSSYIMRRESYVYCVDNYGDDVYYAKEVNGKNNEWFKVMNISVTVSKKMTNRLSAEVEPFIKAPLAGVGEGKVSLVSMGAFINLKYDLIILK